MTTMTESLYLIVVNHEGQYSIWPHERALPLGWSAQGEAASREDCLSRINTLWTDMRPLSLQRRMAANSN